MKEKLKASASLLSFPLILAQLSTLVFADSASDQADEIRRSRTAILLPILQQSMSVEGPISELILDTLQDRNKILFNHSTPISPAYRYSRSIVATLFKDEETRSLVVSTINAQMTVVSDTIKERLSSSKIDSPLVVSELVVGLGPESAAYLQERTQTNPEATILAIDRRSKPGGTFADVGSAFRMNSTNRKYEGRRGSPGSGDLNNLHDIVGTPDFKATRWVEAGAIGELSSVGAFLSSSLALLETDLQAIAKIDSPDGKYVVFLRDLNSDKVFPVITSNITFISGLGKAKAFGDEASQAFIKKEAEDAKKQSRLPRIESAIDLLDRIGDPAEKHPYQEFVGKTVAVIGRGDSGAVVNEFLIRQAPEGAYREDVAQVGNVGKIYWVVGEVKDGGFADCKSFLDKARSRYSSIAQALNSGQLIPVTSAVDGIEATADGKLSLELPRNYRLKLDTTDFGKAGQFLSAKRYSEFLNLFGNDVTKKYIELLDPLPQGTNFDKVIYATGLESELPKLLKNLNEGKAFEKVWEIRETPNPEAFPDQKSTRYAREHIFAPGIRLAGPSNTLLGGLPTQEELGKVGANIVSLFANVERVKMLARTMANGAVSQNAERVRMFRDLMAEALQKKRANLIVTGAKTDSVSLGWTADPNSQASVAKQKNVSLAIKTGLHESLSHLSLSGKRGNLSLEIRAGEESGRYEVSIKGVQTADSALSRVLSATLKSLRGDPLAGSNAPSLALGGSELQGVRALFEKNALLNSALDQFYSKASNQGRSLIVEIPFIREGRLNLREMQISRRR